MEQKYSDRPLKKIAMKQLIIKCPILEKKNQTMVIIVTIQFICIIIANNLFTT